MQQPPNAAQAERAISKHPPFPLQGAHILHKGGGCAPRAGGVPTTGVATGPRTANRARVSPRCMEM